MKTLGVLTIGVLLGAGLLAAGWTVTHPPPPPEKDLPVVIDKIREVARLESLTALTFRKVSFEPEQKQANSRLGEIANWAANTIAPSRGRAIIFADLHLGVDLEQLDEKSIRVRGRTIQLVLPPVVTRVSLRPGDTEFIETNLDAAETAQLMEQARLKIAAEVRNDTRLQQRARRSAENALRSFLQASGFQSVEFVDALPAGGS